MVLLGVCTAATALDLLTALSDEYHQYFPTSFLWVLNIIYFIVLNTATVIYYLYSLALTEKLNNKYKFKKNTYYYTTFLPYIVSLVLILSSPITNWVFYFTEDNIYTRNFGILYLTIASGFYVALSVIMVIHYALKDNKFLIKTHIFYGLFCLVAVILQIAIEGLLIQCFAFAISILILYNNVQRPEYYLDSNTKAYNQAALSILLKKSKYTLVEHSFLDMVLSLISYGSRYYYPIKKGVELLSDEWNKNTKIEYYAEQCGIDNSYFYKLFKIWSGVSPNQYRNQLRVIVAKDLLVHTNLSICEIAQKIGFDDPYYFSRLFKKETGLSPAHYRKAHIL